jgi:hypothetical protein
MKLLVEHLPASLIIGLVGWALSSDPLCLFAALMAGWLIDADHLVDFSCYLKKMGKCTDWSLVKTGQYFKLNKKVIVPLHSWEITVALLIVSIFAIQSPWLWICAAMAHALHLWQDQTTYRVSRFGYWFVFRLRKNFSHQGFCR